MTKAYTPTGKSNKQGENTNTPPKTSITQRLRTDLGRSVVVTIATQLVWLNRLKAENKISRFLFQGIERMVTKRRTNKNGRQGKIVKQLPKRKRKGLKQC